ncbi:MAG: tetratricopeptide repeat protein [Candidatus Pelagibacter sp.]
MKKIFLIILYTFFVIVISFKVYSAGTKAYESLGKDGPPPAGPYRLGFKELQRALKTENKGKLKKAKIKYEKALEHLLEANAEDPANPDILNYLGLTNAKLGFNENAEIYYLLGLELNNEHKSIKLNLGIFYYNNNKIIKAKEILVSLKNCGCKEYNQLKAYIN